MPNLDHHFGSAVLPTALRQVRATNTGVTLHADTEDHDRGLLRSIAEAVRTDDEVVDHLKRYAEIQNALDEIETGSAPNNPAERACLTDEAEDLLVEIDRAMEWQTVGEGIAVPVNHADTETLAGALVGVVAERITTENQPRLRRVETVGGAA